MGFISQSATNFLLIWDRQARLSISNSAIGAVSGQISGLELESSFRPIV
jgi:hypothetical protein